MKGQGAPEGGGCHAAKVRFLVMCEPVLTPVWRENGSHIWLKFRFEHTLKFI
jgi:hypothetical protein